MKLRYFYDPGSGTCLWAADEEARALNGYPVALEMLDLSLHTMALGTRLIASFDGSINWSNPAGPSPWSEEQKSQSLREAAVLYERLVSELGPQITVVNEVHAEQATVPHPEAMSPIQVRQAVLSDLPHLVPLLDAYRVFYGRHSDPEAARRFLLERFNHGESVLFLALSEEGAVGFCQLYPGFSSLSLARSFILNDLYVVPSCRGRGIATMLLNAAAAHARELGAISLTLSTATTNQAAQHVYEREGWIRDQDFYVYNLNLSR
ncbi:MAG: N-acetyltransferase family protein [Synechococcus sp.]